MGSKQDDHQRELLKILLHMKLTRDGESFLFDLCTSVWEKVNKAPSVRFTAFSMLLKIAEHYTELHHEMQFLVQEHFLETLSPAVQKSIRKKVKKFLNIEPGIE
ncbi:MAG: hypothetical protein HC906_15410 [Bacteroidales bacterium]|nr:hypothetical protein [Bacteroidales bacterium]